MYKKSPQKDKMLRTHITVWLHHAIAIKTKKITDNLLVHIVWLFTKRMNNNIQCSKKD